VHLAGVHRLAVESSGIGGGGGASARLPCWLNIRIARIGRGFHGLSRGYVASCRRGNPRDARGAARGGTRDGPAGSGASRYAGQGRRARRQPGRGERISCSTRKPPRVPPRLKAGTPSQFPAGRSRAACLPSSAMAPRDFRKPPNPGRLTAAISSPAAPAGPRNSFSRRPSRRMRATTSPAGLAAPRPARRNSPFSSRAQAEKFSPPPRSGRPGNRRSRCWITGKRPARFPRARRGPG
jgi:hypothetical protein